MQFIAVELTEPPHKLLMLSGRSTEAGGYDIISSILARKSSRYVDYG